MNGPEKPGDIGDPVADNIRNEGMADGVPGAAEREELAREAKECDECGEERVHVYYRTLPDDYMPRVPERGVEL